MLKSAEGLNSEWKNHSQILRVVYEQKPLINVPPESVMVKKNKQQTYVCSFEFGFSTFFQTPSDSDKPNINASESNCNTLRYD